MSANRNIRIIGLTGGIGSGKSMAAAYLEEKGAHCVDADAISHSLTAPDGALLPEIRREFGDGVFFEDGTLNRAELGRIVFSDENQRKRLEYITMPAIQGEMMNRIDELDAAGEKLVFLNVPLLFETGIDVLCDEIWLVSVNEDIQLQRVMSRDGLTEEQARDRIRSQMTLEEKTARATTVIDNNRSIEKMYSELDSHYAALLKRVQREG